MYQTSFFKILSYNHIVLTARVVDFFCRVINVWNCLPPSVDFSTLAAVALTLLILLLFLNVVLIECSFAVSNNAIIGQL